LSEKLSIGGQAVLEGVMMRSPHAFTVAVRKGGKPGAEIALLKEMILPIGERFPLLKKAVLRGSVALFEAMVLGVRAGLDPQRLFDILSTSGGRSHHFLKRFPNVLAGDFTPYFGIALSRKDVALGLGLAASFGLPMPVTSAVRQAYETAHAEGFGNLDMAGVIALYEKWAGVAVRGSGVRS